MTHRTFGAALVVILAGTAPGLALDTGCWHRSYSADHLARNPSQSVAQMTAKLTPGDGEDIVNFLQIRAVFADQGQGVEGRVVPGRAYDQSLLCFAGPRGTEEGWPDWVTPGQPMCAVECDGGSLQIVAQTGDKMDLRTAGFTIGPEDESCGGPVWLTPEGAASVLFRLYPVDDQQCGF